MNFKFLMSLVGAAPLFATAGNLNAITVSNSPIADAFVRSLGSNVSSNFGGAGALEVSGTIATNSGGVQQGAFDSFLRFDISGMVATFNTSFGAGNWTITSANLKVTEVGAPNNAIFNRGAGQFEVQWIANDAWLEGTAMPNGPTTNGIVWADEPTVLASGQASLGTFSNVGADGLRTFALGLSSAFVSDIATDAFKLVSIYMTATSNSTVGFNFNSRNFGTASARPSLELTTVAIPEPSTICLLTLSAAVLSVVRKRRSR